MLDFRRFERGFLLSLVVAALLVGATRLVLHVTTPELQVIVAAESHTTDEELVDGLPMLRQPGQAPSGEDPAPPRVVADLITGQAANGSVLVALVPRPVSQFGMLPYYLGFGWGRAQGWPVAGGTKPALLAAGEADQPSAGERNNMNAITADGRVDLNLATAEELQTLPGIGPALASRILEMREHRGGFVYPEELLDVSGIGPARYKQLADRIIVGPLDP